MKKILLFPLLLLSISSFGQLSDDFTDGDFRTFPSWTGDTAFFLINNGQLRLNDAPPARQSEAFLALEAPTSLQDSTTWEAWIRLEFSPSASNFARIYLAANALPLQAAGEAYYLQIGGISGSEDSLQLVYQQGNQAVLLAGGSPGAVGTGPVTVRIRVTRNAQGHWRLLADYQGQNNFTLEGVASNASFSQARYFGIYCRYTSTRGQSFFFDDIRIDPLFSDRTPPVLTEIRPAGPDSLILAFNEPLDVASATDPSAYRLAPGDRQPELAVSTGAADRVILRFAEPLAQATEYTLSAFNLRDTAGNIAPELSGTFTFFYIQAPAPGELLINELMVDPTPVVATLPEAEYLEVLNPTGKYLSLAGLRLAVGDNTTPLPDLVAAPGATWLLCDRDDAALFAGINRLLVLEDLPTLPNAGARVGITNAAGAIIDEVAYTDNWYADPARSGGGYALERINASLPGDCPGNWRASLDPAGGTPGRPNSGDGLPDDQTGPYLLTALPLDPERILLEFDEAIDPVQALDPANYTLSGGVEVSTVLAETDRRFLLELRQPIAGGQPYQLEIGPLTDCLGNPFEGPQILRIGLPEAPQPGDLIINEVLFNPYTGGEDFVELRNLSAKVLNLRDLSIQNRLKETGTTQTDIRVDYLLFPGEYLALTADAEDIRSRYLVPDTARFLETALPTLEATDGNVTIAYLGVILDAFNYSEDLHYALLDNLRGISLERLSARAATNEPGNWHSAAPTYGGASPGFENTQNRFLDPPADRIFSLVTDRFSPDNDGFEDLLLISYQTDLPGYTLQLRVFDAGGRPIAQLARNELLAAEGLLKWDGVQDNSMPARTGVYLLWAELVRPDGSRKTEKLSFVLTRRD